MSRSEQRFEALKDLGFDVEGISWTPRHATAARRQHVSEVSEKVLARLGLPPDTTGANRKLVSLAESRPFDVLWLDKALSVWPQTVSWLRRKIPHLAIGVWLEEHVEPWLNRSMFLGGVLKQSDCAFTPRCQNLRSGWLKRHAPRELVLVDDTYDRIIHSPWLDECGRPPAPAMDVGFIGTFERERAEDVLFLADNGVRVSVLGSNWHRLHATNLNVTIGAPVFGREYARVLGSTRINLCFLRKSNGDRQTNRTMEIPACGGFMLAERTADHMRLFSEGKEAAFFSDRGELLRAIRYYLANEQERASVARAGHERVVAGGNSHHERMAYMVAVLLAESRRRRRASKFRDGRSG